jgi:predicted aldo/keto reductase-like oxidoreductase
MLYREMGRTGDKVSILGFGCMRLPKTAGRWDERKSEQLIASAIDLGVNYFDTAYLYFGNEALVGKILSGERRDKVLLSTKLPPMQVNSRADMDRLLDIQLERLGTDRIDYYLLHSLMSFETWQRLKRLGIEDFIEKAKRSGKILRVGFSFHGWREQFKMILDDYTWDMAQIQYNYFDEHNQAGCEGLSYAASKGVGVVVMEPLRGGYLVNKLPAEVHDIFDGVSPRRSPAEWGLRWVWNHPGVTMLLSGMNEPAQLDENVRVASSMTPGLLTDAELSMFDSVRELIGKKIKVPCTGCAYCMPCPAGVDIPGCFSLYNDKNLHRGLVRESSYLLRTAGIDGSSPSYASLCRDCGACEKKCPQGLPIRKYLKDVSGDMEKTLFRPSVRVVRGYFRLTAKRLAKRP